MEVKMGIHTDIYREINLSLIDQGKYSIKLFKGDEEIKLKKAVSVREEFYLGKNVWAINEWFYQYFLKEYGRNMRREISYEFIDDWYICIDDLRDLLRKIKNVLKYPEKSEEILPLPKSLILCQPKEGTYENEGDLCIITADTKWKHLSRKEMYDEYYFGSLKFAERLLERIISEDDKNNTGLHYDYIVSVG